MSKISPHFVWMNVGDQDMAFRKACPLGPYLLYIQEMWDDDGLCFQTHVEIFDEVHHNWRVYKCFDTVFISFLEAKQSLEDWYSLNVITDTILLGK